MVDADRLADRAAAAIEECAAVDARRAEGHKLGGNANGETHRGIVQHGPADGLALLQSLLDELTGLPLGELVGLLLALRFLPGVRCLAHRLGKFALEDEVEMAGPHQGLADIGWRDGVGRRHVSPSIGEDTGLLTLDSAAHQHAKDGCSAAENAKRGKRDGQSAVLPLPFSSMRAVRPTVALYQKRHRSIRRGGGLGRWLCPRLPWRRGWARASVLSA